MGGPSHVSMDPDGSQDISLRFDMSAPICQLRLGSSFQEVMSALGLDLANPDDVIIYRSMLVLATLSPPTYTHICQLKLPARSRAGTVPTCPRQKCIVAELQARCGGPSAIPSNPDRLPGILGGSKRDLCVCLSRDSSEIRSGRRETFAWAATIKSCHQLAALGGFTLG
jgi:hypothetical protein